MDATLLVLLSYADLDLNPTIYHKNQLIHPYQPQGKRRAESYNIRRREDAGGLEALDNELEYKIDGEAWQKDDDIEYQYIRSSNM